jgi:hypothetical protein
MLLNDEVQLLRKLPYFSKVDPCKLKLLAFASDRVCYDAGQVIFTRAITAMQRMFCCAAKPIC